MSSTLSYTKHAVRLMDPTTLESINAEYAGKAEKLPK